MVVFNWSQNTHMVNILFSIWLPFAISEYIPPGPRYACPKDTERYLFYPCVCEKGTDDGLFVLCENAGLAVLSVGLGNIAGRGLPIEKLVLNECKISNLFGALLHRSTVRTLEIRNTPIETVDAYTFAGVNRTLQELKMINTKLKEFPKEAFKILGNLSLLYIDGHEITKLDKDIFAGSYITNRLEKLHIVNGQIADIPIEPFQHLKKLKTLDLHGNRITVLKRNQFKGMREAEVLDLSHNNITKLEGVHIADLTKLGWCNVSHNNIADIPRGMFGRNSLLKVVHLNSNKLKKVDGNSIKGLRFLRRLFLQDNQISSVGKETFASSTRIGTIDLARNKLTKVDFQTFQHLRYAEVINLAENKIKTIEKQAFTELYLTTVNVSHNELTDIEAGAFENCQNMTVLDLSHNNLTEIGRHAFDENTYAAELQVSYNRFTDFSQIPIFNMTQIKVVNASHNEIQRIPKASFPKLYELHTVDVSHNKLTEIFNSIFQNLFSIRYLNLSNNDMVQIKPSTFGTIPTLLELDLSHNNLADVSRGSLAKLASCRTLDISHNQLEKIFQIPISLGELNFSYNNLSEIKTNTWPAMNALLRLDLSHNTLEDRLDSDSFRGLLTLQKLDLSANMLTKPPWEALSSLTSLQYIYMRDNNLTSLSKSAFGRLPTMFEVDLTNNQISDISQRAFEGLQQLINLTLTNNELRSIPNEAFKGLVALRRLDLSYNYLEKIDNKTHGLLDDCLSLEMVNLSHNNFGFLTKKTFPYDQYIPYKLLEVDLSDNAIPVLTHDFTIATKKVKKLNLSNNNINDIRNNVLGNLTSLQILDLANNRLKDLASRTSDTKFELPENLTELYLSNNILELLPVDKIVGSQTLRILDVRNNALSSFDPKLVEKIKSDGLQVYFEGNQLMCDCFTRPLKHYLNHLSDGTKRVDPKYKNLTCAEPFSLQDELFTEIDEDRLVCAGSVGHDEKVARYADGDGFDFTAEPDVVFRDVQFAQDAMYANWFVLSSEDVADFVVLLRDSKNNVFYNNVVAYTVRSLTIAIDKDSTDAIQNGGSLELCIQTKNSQHNARKWYPNQCRDLPKDFNSLPKKLNVDKRRLVGKRKSKGFFSNNVLRMVSDSILITLCIFLGVCFRRISHFF